MLPYWILCLFDKEAQDSIIWPIFVLFVGLICVGESVIESWRNGWRLQPFTSKSRDFSTWKSLEFLFFKSRYVGKVWVLYPKSIIWRPRVEARVEAPTSASCQDHYTFRKSVTSQRKRMHESRIWQRSLRVWWVSVLCDYLLIITIIFFKNEKKKDRRGK